MVTTVTTHPLPMGDIMTKTTAPRRIMTRAALALGGAALLGAGALMGATTSGPLATPPAVSAPSPVSDAGGAQGEQETTAAYPVAEDVTDGEHPADGSLDGDGPDAPETAQNAEDAPESQDTPADPAAGQEDDAPEPVEVTPAEDDDVPEVVPVDPSTVDDLPEVTVIEGEDYIPAEGDVSDDEEYVDEESRVIDPDAVSVVLWYGEDGSLEAVNLVGPDGEDVPVGSISEQFGDDDNTDAEG